MLRSFLSAALLAVAAALPVKPASAQTSPAPVAAPEPARLAAAQALIEQIMPADRRDAMVEGMVRPMMDNLRSTMLGSTMFEAAKAKNPKIAAAMNDFIGEEFERSISATKAAMPMMIDSMARAYARRFTLDELKAISVFFDTPAGRAYATKAATIMADPDVLAAQRSLMMQTLGGMQERMATLAEKLKAEAGEAK